MTFQLPVVENKSACKFRKKSTLLLCSTVSYSGAEIYSIVVAGKYCQSYTDPGLNGAEYPG